MQIQIIFIISIDYYMKSKSFIDEINEFEKLHWQKFYYSLLVGLSPVAITVPAQLPTSTLDNQKSEGNDDAPPSYEELFRT